MCTHTNRLWSSWVLELPDELTPRDPRQVPWLPGPGPVAQSSCWPAFWKLASAVKFCRSGTSRTRSARNRTRESRKVPTIYLGGKPFDLQGHSRLLPGLSLESRQVTYTYCCSRVKPLWRCHSPHGRTFSAAQCRARHTTVSR